MSLKLYKVYSNGYIYSCLPPLLTLKIKVNENFQIKESYYAQKKVSMKKEHVLHFPSHISRITSLDKENAMISPC